MTRPRSPRSDVTLIVIGLDAADLALVDQLAESQGLSRSAVALAGVRASLRAFQRQPEAIHRCWPEGYRPMRRAQ